MALEDTATEAKYREERARQVSLQGIEVFTSFRYPNSSKSHTPELVKISGNSELPNLMVMMKNHVEATMVHEGVQFPRTKCCAVIPVSSVGCTNESKRNRKRKRRLKYRLKQGKQV